MESPACAAKDGQGRQGPHTDAHDDKISVEGFSVFQSDASLRDRDRGRAEVELYPMLRVNSPNEISGVRSQNLLHWDRLRRHDIDLDMACA
jgi:hypothetical protein